ncbi:MAG: hydrolase [Bifidobacteriaceae bacterium]|jgi:nicotinamidase-related amidase|nr:hydrolase [Bifidobacteriaceae bacterium]
MTSFPPKDPSQDHLLAPGNAALLLIDYQPVQFESLVSSTKQQIIEAVVALAQTGVAFGLPIVLSTVNVSSGRNKDTVPRLKAVLEGITALDRTQINAWEDEQFNQAVKATGRKKLIIAGLWTEACVTFPSIDALAEGYEVYVVADAVAGTSLVAHNAGLSRIKHAGGQLTTVVQLLCELQRDWARTDTVGAYLKGMFETGAFPQL